MKELLTENEISGFMEKSGLGKHTSRFLKRTKRSEKRLNENKNAKQSVSSETKRVIAEEVVKRLKEQFGVPEDDEEEEMLPPEGEESGMGDMGDMGGMSEEPPEEMPPMGGGEGEGAEEATKEVLDVVLSALAAEFPELDLGLEQDGEDVLGGSSDGDSMMPPPMGGDDMGSDMGDDMGSDMGSDMDGDDMGDGDGDEDEDDERKPLPPLQEAIAKLVEKKVKECIARKNKKNRK